MKVISAEDLNAVSGREQDLVTTPTNQKNKFQPNSIQEFKAKIADMNNPVMAQKELCVMVKEFVDRQIDDELLSVGKLSDYTRRWVETLNVLLVSLNKTIYGEKSVSVNFHQVSHSSIAQKIKEASEDD